MKKYAYIKTLMLIPAFLITTKKWEQPNVHKQNVMYPYAGVLLGNEKE